MLLRTLLTLTLLALLPAVSSSQDRWPQWRGPNGDGTADDPRLPVTWTEKDVVWKTELPGGGQSSPVVWSDRIFLTAFKDRGRERIVLGLDRSNGKMLWQETVWQGEPEPVHKMNGWASATCATDGERVYAFFGRGGGLFCYSADGKKLWEQPLGKFESPWGTAACPILVGDLVVQNCDADADAVLLAFDKLTGKPVWRTPRENQRGWSTPVVVASASGTQLLLNGHSGVRSYDSRTGEELWFCKGYNGRGEPTVTPDGHGKFFVVNGLPGDVYCVSADASQRDGEQHRVWHTPRKGGRDLPSPGVVGDHLLVMSMQGMLTCYSTATGAVEWSERIGGNYSASPTVWQGRAFFLGEEGETVVIDPEAAEHVAARNSLGASNQEIFRASIAAHNGQLLIRSDQNLYCIGGK